MTINSYISKLNRKQNMLRDEATSFLGQILDNHTITDELIAEAITAVTNKGATIEEILGFLDAMQSRMIKLDIDDDVIDTCGTGGDRSGTFNISTASALLIASDGVKVAKHGNRSASSKCGSADVLEELNIPINNSPVEALESLKQHNFCFLFAQAYHPSLKRLGGIRKQLGFPTVFNILGPLLNPASVNRQVIGTFSADNAERIAEIISQKGTNHTLVIRSYDGLDEASLADKTHIIEIKAGRIKEYDIKPDDYNLAPASISDLQGGSSRTNAEIIRSAFKPSEQLSPAQEVIALNAGLGFYVSGKSDSIDNGVTTAQNLLNTDKPSRLLTELANK